MATIDFQDIAHLLNFSGTSYIDGRAVKGLDGRWALYRGTHSVHTATYPFFVLYLNSAATLEQIKNALRETNEFREKDIVYPPTLAPMMKHAAIAPLIGARGVWTTREYLVSFIQKEIQAYLKKLTDQAPIDYVDPHIQTPAGFRRRVPNPVLSFLQDPLPSDSGRLGIVLAEPGQGKTYMSRYLVSRISDVDAGLVPLMVDSSQWHTMLPEDQRSLEKTIAHSFRHFGATIGWLDGHEDEFLRLTLKANIFRIVFDGFDEYILRNRGVQPMEVLEALEELARATGTRIVITSRTSFWNANLPDDEVEAFLSKGNADVFRIEAFNPDQARNYFSSKLTPAQARNAEHIYSVLRQGNEDLVGRGFALSLIADLAAERESAVANIGTTSSPMLWLTDALCERERLRQDLPLTAREQIDMLQTFAVEVAEGGEPTSELLELSMMAVRDTLDSATLKSTAIKLRSHPLIAYDPRNDKWRIKQEQIKITFLAEQLVDWNERRLQRFVTKAKLAPEHWQDLGAAMVDLVTRGKTSDEAQDRLKRLISTMSAATAADRHTLGPTDDASRLGAIVSLMAVERLLPSGASHRERAKMLLRLTGEQAVTALNFSATIARFDFRDVSFEGCRFDRVTWANCKFDDKTKFVECDFVGGAPPEHCKGYGSAQFKKSHLDPDAEAILNSERVREGKRKYSVDDLRSDIGSVIQRFISRGGFGLKTIEASTLSRGPISASRYRDEILAVLKSTMLSEHRMSGALRGYNIAPVATEAVQFYAANNVFTGPLRDAFEKLRVKLSLS